MNVRERITAGGAASSPAARGGLGGTGTGWDAVQTRAQHPRGRLLRAL